MMTLKTTDPRISEDTKKDKYKLETKQHSTTHLQRSYSNCWKQR